MTVHMEALFGAARLAALRPKIAGLPPAEREVLVMASLTEALNMLIRFTPPHTTGRR